MTPPLTDGEASLLRMVANWPDNMPLGGDSQFLQQVAPLQRRRLVSVRNHSRLLWKVTITDAGRAALEEIGK